MDSESFNPIEKVFVRQLLRRATRRPICGEPCKSDFQQELVANNSATSVEHHELCMTYLGSESLSVVAKRSGASSETVYRRHEQSKVELSASHQREYRY